MNPWRFSWATLLGLCLGWTGTLRAEQATPPGSDLSLVKDYVAAAQIVLIQNPFTAAAMRLEGYEKLVWGELSLVPTTAPELNPRLLVDIKDGRTLPNIVGKQRDEIPREDWAVYQTYSEALVKAFETPLDAFKKSAEENRHVVFAHLWNSPNVHRGKVIPIKGRMVKLRHNKAPLPAMEKGVKDLYEGWVFGETKHSNPFCIIFTVLPEGLEPAEEMREDVTFYGYFLMKFKYRGGQEKDLVTPLLIGPTVVVETKARPASSDTPFALVVLYFVLGGLAAMTLLFLVVNFWFRRGDHRILTTIDSIKSKNNPAGFVNEEPEAGPVAPPLARPITGVENPAERSDKDPERN